MSISLPALFRLICGHVFVFASFGRNGIARNERHLLVFVSCHNNKHCIQKFVSGREPPFLFLAILIVLFQFPTNPE